MNLFAPSSTDAVYAYMNKDGIFLPAGAFFFKKCSEPELRIGKIMASEAGRAVREICYIGDFVLRIGVWRDGYSYSWIFEKILHSDKIACEQLAIDLRGIETGFFEIKIYARKDSAIFFAEDFSALDNSKQQQLLGKIFALGDSVANSGNRDAREENPAPEQILYNFIFPSFELCCEEALYCHYSDPGVYYSFEAGYVRFDMRGTLDMLTYFNSFSAAKWAKFTNVKHLALFLDFRGNAVVELVQLIDSEQKSIARFSIKADRRATYVYRLKSMPDKGILGVRITAQAGSALYGGGWASPDPVIQPVKLGIGITTFRREQAVSQAVARLVKAIAAHPVFYDKIAITVVDNGRTLKKEDLPGAMLIPNRNLGGTGGFMRNLLHYQELGGFTHCLFMDDDASCEASSIFRSMSFLAHTKDPATAICGAMLYENIQFRQWENGAWFDGRCHSVNRDLDLRYPEEFAKNEEKKSAEDKKDIYGAWWFFMFPLAQVRQYSLPFFVRGDDIDFSYSNDFKILTLNGVACWQQDFSTKENPLTVYLFMRSHVVNFMTIPQLQSSFHELWKVLWNHFSKFNSSYFYGSAACVNLAMKHVLQGPIFFEQNLEPDTFMAQVKTLSQYERELPYSEAELNELEPAKKNIKTHILPVFLRNVTFNGHLLPAKMIRHTPKDMLRKSKSPNRKRTYMRDQLNIIDELSRKKVVLRRSPALYFKNLFTFLGLSLAFSFRYPSLKKKFQQRARLQRSANFWRDSFENNNGEQI